MHSTVIFPSSNEIEISLIIYVLISPVILDLYLINLLTSSHGISCISKVTLEMQLIPWLDVNKLIRYKSKITGEINTYIIKDISISLLSGKMTVECIMYYPLYPDVI